jgi:hypothetical protein
MNASEKRKIMLLRISYWTGAVLDAIYLIPMLFPHLGGTYFGIKDFNPGGEFRYAMATGAALMLGWTVLLLWADRKPVERRGVLLLTIFPVKVCLDLASLYLLSYHLVTIEKMLLSKIDAILLYVLFIFSYIYSKDLAKKG